MIAIKNIKRKKLRILYIHLKPVFRLTKKAPLPLRLNCCKIGKVKLKCQMEILDKPCKTKTKKVNTTIKYSIFEVVWVPVVNLKLTILIFWTKYTKKGISGKKNRKNEHDLWIRKT